MRSEEISKEIGTLVDHLRASKDQNISLIDIAAATEVLLQATRMYFKNIDTSVFAEVRQMSNLITEMRSDLAHLRPDELKEEKIPRAGMELDAVVKNTEDATNTIMEAAEEIMSADLTEKDNAETVINAACMRIFEACSFQDITGQRVNKVVKTLAQIENGLNSIRSDWVAESGSTEGLAEAGPDADLLNGPALEGEGVDQSEVDSLLRGEPTDDASETDQNATPISDKAVEEADTGETGAEENLTKDTSAPSDEQKKSAEAPKSESSGKSKSPKPSTAKKKPEVAEKPKPEPVKKTEPVQAAAPVSDDDDDDEGETASQADIDALFD